MNSALIGFSRKETEALLPQIEQFAEIGDFIHQPVKTYSTGMYVRLAFSIAISASPRILIIDEALAVGDAVFQHRCVRRIKEMQESGVTVFFVSHDAGAVRALCSRAILLNAGQVLADGKPPDVLNSYQKLIMAREDAYDAETSWATEQAKDHDDSPAGEINLPLHPVFRHGDGSAEVLTVELLDSSRRPVKLLESGEPIAVRLRVLFQKDLEDPVIGFLIRNRHGIHIYGTNTDLQGLSFDPVRRGEILEITFAFECWLAPDTYSITVASHSLDAISFDWLDGALFFEVISAIPVEGVANLNAGVTARRIDVRRMSSDFASTMVIK